MWAKNELVNGLKISEQSIKYAIDELNNAIDSKMMYFTRNQNPSLANVFLVKKFVFEELPKAYTILKENNHQDMFDWWMANNEDLLSKYFLPIIEQKNFENITNISKFIDDLNLKTPQVQNLLKNKLEVLAPFLDSLIYHSKTKIFFPREMTNFLERNKNNQNSQSLKLVFEKMLTAYPKNTAEYSWFERNINQMKNYKVK